MSTSDSGHYGDGVAHRTKRLWTDEEKRSICFQTAAPGVSLAQVALRYADTERSGNPNGSAAGIAGVCDETGAVLGLMPHPENHVVARQHPRHVRGTAAGLGLALFEQGVKYAAGLGGA